MKKKVKMRLKINLSILLVIIGATDSSPDRSYEHHPFDITDEHSSHHDSHPQGICEPIRIGLCMGIGYNQTTMPNLIGHETQTDAEALLQTFSPLIQYGCSSNLKLFLCSAHVPMCTDKIPQPIGPCRTLCESVKSKCEPVLKEFGFTWPESLECSKFHAENTHEHLCNPGPSESPSHFPKREPPSSSFPRSFPTSESGLRKKPPPPPTSQPESCQGPRKVWLKGSCHLKCVLNELGGPFRASEKAFARNYALLWAVLSLSASLVGLVISVCWKRFSVAERPILYLALCQVLYSVGVIIGATSSVSCFVDKATGNNVLAKGGIAPSSCAFVFLLTYFFGIASVLWWVTLCLSWLLSLNRDTSLLQKESSPFHLITWGVASILTSAALIHKKVDADELTGICGVGYQDTTALTLYSLIPLTLSLSIGLTSLTLGLVGRIFSPELLKFLFPKRNPPPPPELSNNSGATTTHQSFHYSPVLIAPPLPHQEFYSNSNQQAPFCNCSGRVVNLYSTGNSPASVVGLGGFQKLRESTQAIWMRVGIFALVHSLPIACQVWTMWYEVSKREDWERGKAHPNLQIFLLRLNMLNISGVTAGVWILSTYSYSALLTFTRKCCLQLPRRTKKSSQSETKVAPLLNPHHQQLPSGSSSAASSNNNHASTMPILGSNNTFTTRGAFAPQNIPSNFPRNQYNHPCPPIPPRNPDHIFESQRTDAWRRGETVV